MGWGRRRVLDKENDLNLSPSAHKGQSRRAIEKNIEAKEDEWLV